MSCQAGKILYSLLVYYAIHHSYTLIISLIQLSTFRNSDHQHCQQPEITTTNLPLPEANTTAVVNNTETPDNSTLAANTTISPDNNATTPATNATDVSKSCVVRMIILKKKKYLHYSPPLMSHLLLAGGWELDHPDATWSWSCRHRTVN